MKRCLRWGILFCNACVIVLISRVSVLAPLTLVVFLPVLFLLENKSWREWIRTGGVLFFLVAFGAYYWVYHVAHSFGGLRPVESLLAVVLFSLMNFWQGAIGLGLFRWLKNSLPIRPSFLFALCMACAWHQVPAIFFWDFSLLVRPWTWLIQSLDLWGGFGLDFFLLWFNYEVFLSIQKKSVKGLILPGLLLVVLNGYGFWRIHSLSEKMDSAKTVEVLLVQPNMDSGEKRDPRYTQGSIEYLLEITNAALRERKPDMIVWPESVFFLNYRYDTHLQTRIKTEMQTWGAPLLFGSTDSSRENGRWVPYNAAFWVRPDVSHPQSYWKHVLLAFGETIPLEKTFPIIRRWLPKEVGNFGRGAGPTVLGTERFHFNPLICYESTQGEYVRKNAKTNADFMVEITNDGWYFQSSALFYHHSLAALRAIENRIGIARDTNTGITVFIDPLGREHGVLPLETAAVSTVTIPQFRPYSFFTQWGYLLKRVATLLLVLVCVGQGLPILKRTFRKS